MFKSHWENQLIGVLMAKANLESEKWFLKQVNNGELTVTKDGRIFRSKTQHEFLAKDSSGYKKVPLQNPENKRIMQIQAHRLIWISFNGLIEDETLQINHINGIKYDCRLSNLELCNQKYNSEHAAENGLLNPTIGENQRASKLLDSEVSFIRRKFAETNGAYSVKDISKEYSISKSSLNGILKGTGYKHVVTGFEEICTEILNNNRVRKINNNNIIDKILNLKSSGLSGYAIGKELGISPNTARKYMSRKQ